MTRLSWLLLLACAGCKATADVGLLSPTKTDTSKVESKVADAINEVGELRYSVHAKINQVQDSAVPWMVALLVVSVLGAAFPVVMLLLIAYLAKKWLLRNLNGHAKSG